MEFRNHTPFPALAFGGVDTREQSFHVLVLRQTLTWGADGLLVFSDEQSPLCMADEPFDAESPSSVRQESDLCTYKPLADVIVNATAHPPRTSDGRSASRFEVRLVIARPGAPASIPPSPYGLNPLMPPSPEALREWQAEVERARRTQVSGERLIDKKLVITGPREFTRRTGLARASASLARLGTFGAVRMSTWSLNDPAAAAALPVRLEHAFGGQCRVDSSTPAAEKVGAKSRLSTEQIAAHPDAPLAPVAHEAYEANVLGAGYIREWFIEATGLDRVQAPRIESPGSPVTLSLFDRIRTGASPLPGSPVVGLGVRPKGHPDRACLVGTIDEPFVQGTAALPADFDFAVWNAAWPDQQVQLLGDEQIILRNLCDAGTPAAVVEAGGDIVLTLALQGDLPFVLVRYADGSIGELPARLDTLVIDPEEREISCVWRATVASSPEVRVLEFRMLSREEARGTEESFNVTDRPAEVAHGK